MQYSVVNYKTVRKADDFRWDGEFLCFEPHKSKHLSKSLLEIAKQGVEMAIEKDEKEAKRWIDNELAKFGMKIYRKLYGLDAIYILYIIYL